MRSAVLTIDDSPTINTLGILAFLRQRNISAVFFCIGTNLDAQHEISLEIIRAGHEVGNHSYSHSRFSDLSLYECIEEIEKTETIINGLYSSVDVKRTAKYFRFPFGDKGGRNQLAIQDYLKKKGFSRFLDVSVAYSWYHEHRLDMDSDVFWTFDCEDYRLYISNASFQMNDVYAHLIDASPANGGSLVSGVGDEVILVHDYAETHAQFHENLHNIIGTIQTLGIHFMKP